ncbi:hypothetical protein BOO93_20235 [Vibrio navarrensis]|nr:hypothetical protein [Vibrio navarrensis]
MQNFQSDFAANWLTSCNPKPQLRQPLETHVDKQCEFADKTERIAKGQRKKEKNQPIDFNCFKLTPR